MRARLPFLLTVFLAVAPLQSDADVVRCHTAIQAEIGRLTAEIGKAVQSCAAIARRARAAGQHLSRAADQCERSLMKIYNAAGVPGRSLLDRFRTNLERLHPNKCSDADLLAMRYFVPGINAPGSRGPCTEGGQACTRDSDCTGRRSFCPGAMGDVIRRFVVLADNSARRAQLQAMPELAELLEALVHVRPGGPNELGTDDCSRSPSAPPTSDSHRARPNLCLLENYLPCALRQCSLSIDSEITFAPLGLPIELGDRTLPVEICNVDDVLLLNLPAQSFAPAAVGQHLVTTCLDVVTAQGWCDCSASGQRSPFVPQLCVDHVIDAQGADECGPSTQLIDQETGCGCASLGGLPQAEPRPPCSTKGCDRCVHVASDAPCHANTRNGPLHLQWSGESATNDCALQSTLRLSFLPAAFCRAANGEVRGLCPGPGPADAECAAVGGTTCSDPRGPNGVACDSDDDTPWTLFPLHANLTTGTPKARVADWVLSEGVCTGDGNLNCIEDRNCVAPSTCAGAIFGCGSGAGANDCEVSAASGAALACDDLRAGALAGWKLEGVTPRLDQPAGLRDSFVRVTLACE